MSKWVELERLFSEEDNMAARRPFRKETSIMRNLYEPDAVEELKRRVALLQRDSPRQWGKMTPGQALAHYSAQMEMTLGQTFPQRSLMGRLLGRFAKAKMLGRSPLQKNMPTDELFIINDERDLDGERERLVRLVDQFVAGGASTCTTHPHSFLGQMTPLEWATLMYKHLDHHLRQFGV
jgi:hypothetical protein